MIIPRSSDYKGLLRNLTLVFGDDKPSDSPDWSGKRALGILPLFLWVGPLFPLVLNRRLPQQTRSLQSQLCNSQHLNFKPDLFVLPSTLSLTPPLTQSHFRNGLVSKRSNTTS